MEWCLCYVCCASELEFNLRTFSACNGGLSKSFLSDIMFAVFIKIFNILIKCMKHTVKIINIWNVIFITFMFICQQVAMVHKADF